MFDDQARDHQPPAEAVLRGQTRRVLQRDRALQPLSARFDAHAAAQLTRIRRAVPAPAKTRGVRGRHVLRRARPSTPGVRLERTEQAERNGHGGS